MHCPRPEKFTDKGKNKMKKKYYAAVVGYGNRGQVYADYSLDCPDELGIAAVIDPNEFKLSEAAKRYELSKDQLFTSFEDFEKSDIKPDFVINATMDQDHYKTAMQVLRAGYHMLLEKPITANKDELLDISRLAKEKGLNVFICHVLRYTPFYRTIKELINNGEIGEIMSMEMNEHVGISHYLVSYDRGKWNSEGACGSSFLLAKCCHDLDLICWLNNSSSPDRIASFGHRRQFVPEKAPEGAAEYCHECKYEATCMYSATHEYIEKNTLPFLVWDKLNKPLDEITEEEKREFLKTDIYGKCGYKTGGDIVDRQNLIIDFENGSVANFMLTGGCTEAGRRIHIVGSEGEIEGRLEDNKFIIRRYQRGYASGKSEEIVLDPVNNAKFGGHNGGDFAIMHDLIAYLDGDRSSVSITSIDDSVNGHLCIYAADESRRTNNVVKIEKQ